MRWTPYSKKTKFYFSEYHNACNTYRVEQVFVTNGVDSMQFLEIEVPSCHPSSSFYSKKLSQGEMINRQLLHRINGEMEFVVSLLPTTFRYLILFLEKLCQATRKFLMSDLFLGASSSVYVLCDLMILIFCQSRSYKLFN